MINTLLNTSLIKDVMNIIFNKNIGLNLDLDKINIDKGIGLNYKHINLDPRILNQAVFNQSFSKGINLCFTKISITNLVIKISMNEFIVSIDEISITIMPITQKQTANQTKREEMGLMDSIINYYLTKLEIKVNRITLHLLNYETKNSNLTYANPSLSLRFGTISYSKGSNNNDNKEKKYIYNNKVLIINKFSLVIEKNYRPELSNEISDKEGNTQENGVILSIDTKSGISVNIQYDNEAFISIGIIQIVINPIQLELLRNIIYSYMKYINFTNSNNDINKGLSSKKKLKVVKEEVNYYLQFCLKGLSIILYEYNSRSDLPKYFLFDYTHQSIQEHFCYYEDNYFLLLSHEMDFSIQKRDLKFKINDLKMSYVEFIPYIRGDINHYDDNVSTSIYEDAEVYIENNNNANDIFYSVHDSNIYHKKELKLNHNYRLINHDIIDFNYTNVAIGKELVINIKEIIVHFHLCYLFKALKVLYSNSTLLNEILFFNNNSRKQFNSQNPNPIENINKVKYEEAMKSTVPNSNLNKSKQISIHMTIKLHIDTIEADFQFFKLETDFESTITPFFTEFYYDSIFMMDTKENYQKKFDIFSITSNNIIKIQIKNYELLFNNKLLNMKLSSFNSLFNNKRILNSNSKCEFNLTKGLINPQKAQTLNSKRENDILLHPLLEIDLKVSLNCTIIAWLLKDMITSINVFCYSMFVLKIFNKHMMLNHNKIRSEIDNMYDLTSYTNLVSQSLIVNKDKDKHYNTYISLQVKDLYFNIKTFYDTDNLTFSFDKSKMTMIIIKDSHSQYKTKDIEMRFVLNEISSKRLFSLNHLFFFFTIEIQKNNPKGLFINKLIQPEFLFEDFMEKYIMKKVKGISPDYTIISHLLIKVVIGHLFLRPQNILLLIKDVLPQIITKDDINNNCFVPIFEWNITKLDHISDYEFGIDDDYNYINKNTNKKDNDNDIIDFNIQFHQFFFELNQEQLSNTNINEKCNIVLELKEFIIELIKEINKEKNKYLKCTCFSINDVIFHIINFDKTEMKIGEINAMFCKDSLLSLINILNDQIEIIIAIFNILASSKSSKKSIELNNFIGNSTLNQSIMTTNTLNNSTMSTNTNYYSTISSLNVDDHYLNTSSSNRIPKRGSFHKKYINKEMRKIFKPKDISLIISDIHLSLYAGQDFESQIDFEPSDVNKICCNEDLDFINIEPEQFEIKSKRNEENYIMLSFNHFRFKSKYEMDNFYNTQLEVGNTDIIDNLKASQVKRMMSREDIKSTIPIIKSSLEISNSFNSISSSYYEDFEVIISIEIQPIALYIDQKALEFILGFFVIKKKEKQPKSGFSNEDNEVLSIPYQIQDIHNITDINSHQFTQSTIQQDKAFSHLNHHSFRSKQSFIYIKSITFKKSCLYITYEAHTYLFELNGKSFPLPSVQNYPLTFETYCFNGYSQSQEILPIIKKMFMDQLPSTKLLFHLISSLKVTKPITHIIKDFFHIFTNPYYSYKANKGFVQGLIAGVKNFLIGIVSQNVLIGEMTLKTLTTLVGLTKSNKINNKSFYSKYCMSKKKQRYNDYFYKS